MKRRGPIFRLYIYEKKEDCLSAVGSCSLRYMDCYRLRYAFNMNEKNILELVRQGMVNQVMLIGEWNVMIEFDFWSREETEFLKIERYNWFC